MPAQWQLWKLKGRHTIPRCRRRQLWKARQAVVYSRTGHTCISHLVCWACACAGMQRWSDAVDCFSKATSLSRDFSFAAANKALALYQLGSTEEAIRCF